LKKAEQERIAVAEGFTMIGQKIQEDKSRIEQLLQEKISLEDTLKLREYQLQLQQQSATRERELQQKFISLQQKEITGLEKRLKRVEHELDVTKPRLLSLQEELQKVSLELAKKSTEVQKLLETQEKMRLKLEIDRRGLDNHLMHHAATNTSEVEVSTV